MAVRVEQVSKPCAVCGLEFMPVRRSHLYCGEPCKKRSKRARLTDEDAAERNRVGNLRRKYGLTPERWQELFDAQGRRCAICSTTEARWNVDHDHGCCPGKKTCGRCVRGILCNSCNTGIGYLRDDADRAISAALYLMRGESNGC